MQLILTNKYKKIELKFLNKNKNLINAYMETLKKLANNPFDQSLRTHKLKGNLSDFYSCSINLSYRISMIIEINQNQITLINVGTHDEVYGK